MQESQLEVVETRDTYTTQALSHSSNTKSIEEGFGAGRLSTTQRVSKRVMGQVVFLQHKEYQRELWGRSSFCNTKSIEEGYGTGRLSITQRVSKRDMGQVAFL